MIDSAMIANPDQEYVINDLSSAIFNTFLGIGQVTAPLYSTTMTSNFNFQYTAEVLGIFCCGFGLVYFIFGGGIDALRNSSCTGTQIGIGLDTSLLYNPAASHQSLLRDKVIRSYSP